MVVNTWLPRVADPHCGRYCDDEITFSYGSDEWSVRWGHYDAFGSPAYWVDQTVRGRYAERLTASARSTSVLSEAVFCLLGGFGVTAESAHAAHVAVLRLLATRPSPAADEVEEVLLAPCRAGWAATGSHTSGHSGWQKQWQDSAPIPRRRILYYSGTICSAYTVSARRRLRGSSATLVARRR